MQLSPVPTDTRLLYPKAQTLGGLEASSNGVWAIPSRMKKFIQLHEVHCPTLPHHRYQYRHHQEVDATASVPAQSAFQTEVSVPKYPCGDFCQTISQQMVEDNNKFLIEPGTSPHDVSYLNTSHHIVSNHLPLDFYYPYPSVPYPAYHPRNRQPQFVCLNTPSSVQSTDGYRRFNPRTAVKMSHTEKVKNWIDQVPVFPLEDGAWGHNCYANDYQPDYEEAEFDDIRSGPISLESCDELLFFQSKRIDCLVRKLYNNEGNVSGGVE